MIRLYKILQWLGIVRFIVPPGEGGSGEGDDVPDGFVKQADHDAAIAQLQDQVKSARNEGSPFVNADGSFKDGWQNQLGKDIDPNAPFFQKTKHLPNLVRSYMALESMQGANTVKIPTDHSSDADRALFRERMGIPDGPDGYEVVKPQVMPEGMEFDESRANHFKKVASEVGLTRSQFQKLVQADIDYWGDVIKTSSEAQASAREDQLQQVKAEVGEAGVKTFNRMLEWINQKLSTSDKPVDISKDPAFANSPTAIKVLATIGEAFGEDKLPRLESDITPMTAERELHDIRTNPHNRYHHAYNNGNEDAIQHVRKLTKIVTKAKTASLMAANG